MKRGAEPVSDETDGGEKRGRVTLPSGNHGKVPGLWLEEDFITKQEEKDLLRRINEAAWQTSLKRRVQHYGYEYSYSRKASSKYIGQLPGWIVPFRDRLTARGMEEADQVIVNEYVPGQGISAHVDAPNLFADGIASITLGSAVTMDLINGDAVEAIRLQRRSLVTMHGEARYQWKHRIAGRKSDLVNGSRVQRGTRVSLTFRRLKAPTCEEERE